MNPNEFVRKWQSSELKERSACQEHFLDLCKLIGHPTPAEVDKTGESFTFERGAHKHGGGEGWADVWKRGFFGWEYKGKRKDLNAAYDQLLQYRESLENPPLLIVSDMDRIEIHCNFTNCPAEVHTLTMADIGTPRGLEILRAVFHDPETLKPGRTSQAITTEAARKVGEIAQALRQRGEDPHHVAHFLDRLVFCMFAEDIGLLQNQLFTKLLEKCKAEPERFAKLVRGLFEAMANGGDFGMDEIRHFNGALFSDGPVLSLDAGEIRTLAEATALDWGAVDPSIFGTLFERGLDPDKRTQLGAHYTSREDIETLVEPVVMKPLRRKWEAARSEAEAWLEKEAKRKDKQKAKGAAQEKADKISENLKKATDAIAKFLVELAAVKVLDPACGSGNFLYVTLQKMKDLEKEIILWSDDHNLGRPLPMVHPKQLYGIEISPYAFDLAQMTVWIGYLQWIRVNGFGEPGQPILEKLPDNFRNMDAILDLADPEHPCEPAWPEVDFIVGNPPFLGRSFLREHLGDKQLDAMFFVYSSRLPESSDLSCYWFEKARRQIEMNKCKRAGLLATQGIRGGLNREVLKRIKINGNIFFAESDRPWVLDGANVHISMVGFDDGAETECVLDGLPVLAIHSNLSAIVDVTCAKRIISSRHICSRGSQKRGAFDISYERAIEYLTYSGNPSGDANSNVIVPFFNGSDIVQGSKNRWVIDFGVDMEEKHACMYEAPYEYTINHIRPERLKNNDQRLRKWWWIHGITQPEMRKQITKLHRYIVSPRVSKHRIFQWMEMPSLPDDQLIVFARADDYFFGVLHSRFHETWALTLGTRLETRPRYTPTSCFETFPMPWNPGEEPTGDPSVADIAAAAHELDTLRKNWLNPPEWTREEVLEFPGSVDGPWARYVHDPDARGIGTVRYPRIVPKDEPCAARLRKRTLTNLYNERPAWLDNAHRKLDEAVAAAYRQATSDACWTADMAGDDILAKLLAMNLERAAGQGTLLPAPSADEDDPDGEEE